VVTGPVFPAIRLVIWTLQIPLVLARPSVASLVTYLTILSIAAGIESALTDFVEAWKFVAEDPELDEGVPAPRKSPA